MSCNGIHLRTKEEMAIRDEAMRRAHYPTPPREKSAFIKRLGHCKNAIRQNYVNCIHFSLVLFFVTFVWTIVFSLKTLLGINFLMLLLFTCLMVIIVASAYARDVVQVAGVAVPIYIAGCLLFTTMYVFNPPSYLFGVYAKNGETHVVSYAAEPWVDRYDPHVWKNTLFYVDNFTIEARKYIELDTRDILVKLSIKFAFDSDLAKINFAALDTESKEHDNDMAIKTLRPLLANSVKALLASEDFIRTIESLDQTLVHLSDTKKHETKREVFQKLFEDFVRKRASEQQITTLLYRPLFESAKITLGNVIYERPSN